MQIDLNGFVARFILREIKKFYVSMFTLLEDIRDDGYINEEVYSKLRKKVLDAGNGCARAIDDQLKEVEFTLKKK